MATADAVKVPGLRLSGELLGTEQQRDREADGKTYPGRFIVKILADDRVVQLEYRDQGEALAAVTAANGGSAPERGDWLSLAVGVRSAKGYTFYYGLRS